MKFIITHMLWPFCSNVFEKKDYRIARVFFLSSSIAPAILEHRHGGIWDWEKKKKKKDKPLSPLSKHTLCKNEIGSLKSESFHSYGIENQQLCFSLAEGDGFYLMANPRRVCEEGGRRGGQGGFRVGDATRACWSWVEFVFEGKLGHRKVFQEMCGLEIKSAA